MVIFSLNSASGSDCRRLKKKKKCTLIEILECDVTETIIEYKGGKEICLI